MGHQAKRSLLIVGPLPPPLNGMSVVTDLILRDAELRERFDVFHLDTSDHRGSVENQGRLDLVNIGLALVHSIRFFGALLRRRPDIVYVPIAQNTLGFLRDAVFLAAARMLGRNMVVHLHGGHFHRFFFHAGTPLRGLIRYCLSEAQAGIVLAESLRDRLECVMPREHVFVVPNGVQDHFDGFHRPERPQRTILYVGNLMRAKGVEALVRSIPAVLAAVPDARFVLAGGWADSNERERCEGFVVENGLSSAVTFLGPIGLDRKAAEFRAADLFVFPTFYPFEGQPLVIIEAMSASLPIVTTNWAAIPETTPGGENATFVKTDDAESLAEGIVSMILSPEKCKRMGEANRARYLKHYTQRAFMSALLGVFESVALRKEN